MTPASADPQAFQESERAPLGVGAVVTTHDWFDGFGSFISVVKGDRADVMMQNVCLNNAVENTAADETEFSVNSCGGTTDIVPASSCVVRKRRIGVLKIGNGN